jgi:hypothetical protein
MLYAMVAEIFLIKFRTVFSAIVCNELLDSAVGLAFNEGLPFSEGGEGIALFRKEIYPSLSGMIIYEVQGIEFTTGGYILRPSDIGEDNIKNPLGSLPLTYLQHRHLGLFTKDTVFAGWRYGGKVGRHPVAIPFLAIAIMDW